jgi:hypothetical protein
MRFDKRSCLKRAEDMLAAGDDSALRYACLELRFCMEAIVYAKLELYSGRLPKKIFSKWQPPQAMRALLAIEPHAAENFELAFSWESAPGVPEGQPVSLGQHRSINPGWLRKHYNKLGNLLHIPPPGSGSANRSPAEIREYLQGVVAELAPVVASRIDTSLASTISFECSECGELVVCNSEGVVESRRATCLNPACEAEFFAVDDQGGGLSFKLVASYFDCHNCNEKTPVENRKLATGLCFKCRQCGVEYKIMGRKWAYAPVEALSAANPAEADT